MMSSQGAIKKSTQSNSHSKNQISQKVRSSSQTRNEPEEKTEKKEKRKEPQIKDVKTSVDRKMKTALASKNILPDKNPVKLKQLKHNAFSTSKSSFEEPSLTSSSKKQSLSKLKSEGTAKSGVISDKTKISNQKTTKEKVKAAYNEKRGTSIIYAPKDAAAKLRSLSKSLEPKEGKEKSTRSRSSERKATVLNNLESRDSESKTAVLKKSDERLPTPRKSETRTSTAKKSEERPSTSKSMDKKVLKSESSKKSLPRSTSRERLKSRALSSSEIKVLQASTTNKTKSKIIKTKTEETIKPKENKKDNQHNDEDEFEDYESNYEEYTGSHISEISDASDISLDLEPIILRSEQKVRTINSASIRKPEENKLDSGHYELTEAKRRAAMVESLMATREETPPPIPEQKQTENYHLNNKNSQSYRGEKPFEIKSLPSSADEGFEDSRSGDFVKSSLVAQVTFVSKEIVKEEDIIQVPPKALTRGKVLMSMIKFDTVEVSLYESKPISYDEFIRSYGKLNTQQISTQTNEDNLDVEIQTDINELENKWTQFPVKCRNQLNTNEDVKLFKIENVGVGGDKQDSILDNPSYDVLKLNEFLSRAGKVVLALLEEKEFGGNILQSDTHEFQFSEGFVKLSVNSLSFLCGKKVTMLLYSDINNKILMSIHAPTHEIIEPTNKQDYITSCCIGCLWNVNEPSKPIKLFYSQHPITASCFHCTNNNIIFAGLQDGSVCIWDLREEETWHQKIADKTNEMDWIIRSPTYTTAGNWEVEAHISPIVAIQIVSKIDQDETEALNDKFISIQICTLDEEGRLIIWSVLRNLSLNSDDLGLTQWGKIRLVKSQEVPLSLRKSELNSMKKQFIDMNVDYVDSNNLYLATNDTNIMCMNCIGGRNSTPFYKISEMDSCGNTTCIEVCPFKQSYFLVGCKDGSIRLHSSNIGNSLLKLKDEKSFAGIKSIQWSKSKPLTVYILDDHSRIVVWNLSNSDIHPEYSVPTKDLGYVKCMRLSPCNTNRDMLNQYLALGTDTGNIEVHKLKKEFYYSQQDDIFQELNTFLQYVSIL